MLHEALMKINIICTDSHLTVSHQLNLIFACLIKQQDIDSYYILHNFIEKCQFLI